MRFVGFYKQLDNNCFNFSLLVKEKSTGGDLTICSEWMIYEMKNGALDLSKEGLYIYYMFVFY